MYEKFCKYFILFLELATSGIEPKLAVHETTVLPIHFLAYHKCVFFRTIFLASLSKRDAGLIYNGPGPYRAGP